MTKRWAWQWPDERALEILTDLNARREKIDNVIAAIRDLQGWGPVRDPETGIITIPPQPNYGQVSPETHEYVPGYYILRSVGAA